MSQHLDSRHGSHGRMTGTEESIGRFLVTSVPTRGRTLITITENGLSSESGAAREITGDDKDDDRDQWLPTVNSVLYWYVLCVLALLKSCYSRASESKSLLGWSRRRLCNVTVIAETQPGGSSMCTAMIDALELGDTTY